MCIKHTIKIKNEISPSLMDTLSEQDAIPKRSGRKACNRLGQIWMFFHLIHHLIGLRFTFWPIIHQNNANSTYTIH